MYLWGMATVFVCPSSSVEQNIIQHLYAFSPYLCTRFCRPWMTVKLLRSHELWLLLFDHGNACFGNSFNTYTVGVLGVLQKGAVLVRDKFTLLHYAEKHSCGWLIWKTPLTVQMSWKHSTVTTGVMKNIHYRSHEKNPLTLQVSWKNPLTVQVSWKKSTYTTGVMKKIHLQYMCHEKIHLHYRCHCPSQK